ncbi:MAG: RlmE family RNA methyltransferase [Thermodesulfobacteriota bacterium]
MKRVKDHYFHKAKKEKYPARSVYKLEEAQKKYGFLKKGFKILDLGCHPGSWSMYASKVVGPQGKVVGVDFKKSNARAGAGMAPLEFFQLDIFSDDSPEKIKQEGPFQGVISDLAPRTTGNKFIDHVRSVELVERALTIATRVLVQDGFFYCKLFQGEDFQPFVDKLNNIFRKVRTVKPKSSRGESREVFTLGTGYMLRTKED